jgi:hypothetical protein
MRLALHPILARCHGFTQCAAVPMLASASQTL